MADYIPHEGKPPPRRRPYHHSGPRHKFKHHRHCYTCGDGIARKLTKISHGDRGPIFCSLQCAAQAAVEDILATNLRWCPIHDDWTDEKGHCFQCQRLHCAQEEAGVVTSPAQIATTEEVPHE